MSTKNRKMKKNIEEVIENDSVQEFSAKELYDMKKEEKEKEKQKNSKKIKKVGKKKKNSDSSLVARVFAVFMLLLMIASFVISVAAYLFQ